MFNGYLTIIQSQKLMERNLIRKKKNIEIEVLTLLIWLIILLIIEGWCN